MFFGDVHLSASSGVNRRTVATKMRDGQVVGGRPFDIAAFNKKIRGVQLAPVLSSKEARVGSLAQQLQQVNLPTYGSVVTLAPANDLLDDYAVKTKALNSVTYRYYAEHPTGLIKTEAPKNNLYSLASRADSLLNAEKRLVCGLALDWEKGGDVGMPAFASASPAYADYQYWVIKGPHKDGDRFNNPAEPIVMYGSENQLRLENVSRKGNLGLTTIKSPFGTIFEGTASPIKDKYTLVNLSGVGSGVGTVNDNWYFMTYAGDKYDTSVVGTGISYVLKGAYVALGSNISGLTKALSMPVYARDVDPDFGVGVKITADSDWTTANRGPDIWAMDLGLDQVMAVGGTVDQGGLQGEIVQKFSVYLWGKNQRAFLNADNPALCVNTRDGKARDWLPALAGWMRTTEPYETAKTFFQWPGDGKAGVGRVASINEFPAANQGIDLGLSSWNGSPLFRFRAQRIKKGGYGWHDKTDYGVYWTQPIGGVDFAKKVLPWTTPKIKGTPDGNFDAASGVQSVLEVSARTGDMTKGPSGSVAGSTLWRLKDIYPPQVLQRCAGRGDAEAIAKLKKFFGITMPAYVPFDSSAVVSEDFSNIRYGAVSLLRHAESGKYLAVSNVAHPDYPGVFYLTCVSDPASAGQWMVAPGLGLAAQAGGVAVRSGDGIRLVDRVTKKTLLAVKGLPPLSLNFAVPNLEMLSTPSGAPMLRAFDLPAVACSGNPPDEKLEYPATNWIVRRSFKPAAASAQPGATQGQVPFGVSFFSQALSGFLSSVNGYVFKSATGSSDWLQEVTVFDNGSTTTADVGTFGVWALENVVPAPSVQADVITAGFSGPFSLVDGSNLNLVQVATGSDGCLYGVDGSGNAVKVDLSKKTSEQLATGVKKIVVGTDDAVLMLKNDGTVVMRPAGGADQSVAGCMGRDVAIGSATKFAAVSADGGVLGHVMLNQGQQLLASTKDASSVDITDDGYVFAVVTKAADGNSRLLIAQQSNPSSWQEVSLAVLGEKIRRVSAGSTRFIILHGEKGTLWKLAPDKGEAFFDDPTSLITRSAELAQASSWKKITIDPTGVNARAASILVADASISANGLLTVLAGQVTANFDFQVFTISLAPWPDSSVMFNLKVETTAPVAAADGVAARSAVYSNPLVSDSANGQLIAVADAEKIQATGGAGQFCLISSDGYVTLQTKNSATVKVGNVPLGLKKDDPLQNLNLMTGKTASGVILTTGVSLDQVIEQDQLSVGFGGKKFRSTDDSAVLEKFMFYLEGAPATGGVVRFKLQSKASGGFLQFNPTTSKIVSLKKVDGKAVLLEREEGSVFVLTPLAATSLKLQQALVGKNPRETMDVFESAWLDQTNFVNGADSFFVLLERWLEGLRISPVSWVDFTETVSDWTNPADRLKKSITACARLNMLLSDQSILSNPIIKQLFADPADATKMRIIDSAEKLATVRAACDPARTPTNLGLIKNVKDGSIVALRSLWGIDANGCLTQSRGKIVKDLYVAVDAASGAVKLSGITSLDASAQFYMKVVPSPLASARSVDEGHDASDIQRWMFQASTTPDAATKRLNVPVLPNSLVLDSRETALRRYVLQWTGLAGTDQPTLLPAYFDVQSVGARLTPLVVLQSAVNSGYVGVGRTDTAKKLKEGLAVDETTDLTLRTQDAVESGQGNEFKPSPLLLGDAAQFEIVIITPVMQQLSEAFKKTSFDEQVASFFDVSSKLEKIVDAITFCDALNSMIRSTVRSSQEAWNKYVANRAAREKLMSSLDNIKRLFSADYNASASASKSYIDGLANTLDIARVPSFGTTKNRAEMLVDLEKQIADLAATGATEKFVTSGGQKTFMAALQQAVNDWFTSAGIAVDDSGVSADGKRLAVVIDGYRKALGVSLSKADTATLDGLVATLGNTKTQVNPIDILQNILTTNTTNGLVTFGSDTKYSFMNKLWELYRSSTLEPEGQIPAVVDGKITNRGAVFGLTPAQITQLSELLKTVSKAPDSPTAVGGPFFADDAKGGIRSGAVKEGGWGWTTQPFMDMTNAQIINQFALLFVAPTFSEFVATYLQYLAANQDSLATLATSGDEASLAQVQRFVVRLLGLAEQWTSWSKAATSRQQRQELNQFKTLVRAVRSFVRADQEMKARVEKLLGIIQAAIDQLS